MQIDLFPIRADAALALHRQGDILSVAGIAYDFGPLPEGATLPRAAIGCPWLAGDVARHDSVLHLALMLPHGPGAGAEALFPARLPAPAGPVDLPGQPGAQGPADQPGPIDWAALRTPDPAADLAQARAAAEIRLAEAIEAATLALTGTVPLTEKLSWAAKEEAARALLDGKAGTAERALLEGEAAVTGEDVADLAARVLRNAETWRQAIARLSGLRRRTVAALAGAADPAAIAAALTEGLAALEG